jgi:hypothetical protein
MRRLLVTADVVPSSPILVTLMKETLSSSETLVLKRATRRNIPEDGILQRGDGFVSLIGLLKRASLDQWKMTDVTSTGCPVTKTKPQMSKGPSLFCT